MSTFRNPVGPQSSGVYWRRRLVVLLGLVAVIVIIALLVVRPGSSAGGEADNTAASSTKDEAETDEVAATPEPVEGADCDPSVVKVDAITDKDSYDVGEQPQLSFSITNTSGTACMFNAGTTQQTFQVTSGEEPYWSSKDCETAPVDAPVMLEPNVAQSSPAIAWDRTRSSTTTCEGERPAVTGGGATYNLLVTVGAVTAVAPKSFLLY